MARPSVNTSLSNGNLARSGADLDGVAALVMYSPAAPSGLAVDTEATIYTLKEAEDLGITAAFDATNNVFVHRQIKDFYRGIEKITGDNRAELHIMVSTVGANVGLLTDEGNNYLAKIIRDNQGRVRLAAVAGSSDGATPTIANGLDEDVATAITNGQELVVQQSGFDRDFHLFIEGRSFNGTAADLTDHRAAGTAYGCSVVLCAEKSVGDSADVTGSEEYASVGLILGLATAVPVQQNIGRVLNGPILTSDAALSSNEVLEDFTDSELTTIHDKGYITWERVVPSTSSGLVQPGYYVTNDNNCAASTNDYASVSDHRTITKAKRIAKDVYTTRLKDNINLLDTGRMTPGAIKSFQNIMNAALETEMVAKGNVSAANVFIDPTQNVQSTDQIAITLNVTRLGQAKTISVDVGFTPPTA